jgi:hypothetical protein
MTDKHRRRRQPAPHGVLPNWALLCVMACATVIAGLSGSFSG